MSTTLGTMADPCKQATGITSANYFHKAIANAKTSSDYLKDVATVIPERVSNGWHGQKAFAEYLFGKEPKKDPEPLRWTPPRRARPFAEIPIISLWKKMFINRTYRGRQVNRPNILINNIYNKTNKIKIQVTLWLIGNTQTAKSSFAKNLGRYCYIKGNLDSNSVHTNCDLLIIDDVDIEKLPFYKSFMNCDPFQVRTAYNRSKEFDHGTKYGKQGIPCVWTTNYDPRRLPSTNTCDLHKLD